GACRCAAAHAVEASGAAHGLDLGVDLVLAREGRVQRLERDAGLGCHVLHRALVEALLREDALGALEDQVVIHARPGGFEIRILLLHWGYPTSPTRNFDSLPIGAGVQDRLGIPPGPAGPSRLYSRGNCLFINVFTINSCFFYYVPLTVKR